MTVLGEVLHQHILHMGVALMGERQFGPGEPGEAAG